MYFLEEATKRCIEVDYMAKTKEEILEMISNERRDTYIAEKITPEMLMEVRQLLNLQGECDYFDRYLAGYHFFYPENIGSKNYKELLIRRNLDFEYSKRQEKESTKEVQKKKPIQRKLTFEDKCDEILVDFENDDFSKLNSLNARQVKWMRSKIYSFHDSEKDLKDMDPIGYKIYHMLGELESKVQTDREKKRIQKHLNSLNILTEFGNIQGRKVKEFYTSSKFIGLYDTKRHVAILGELEPIEGRWKGARTLLGKFKIVNCLPNIIPQLLLARSSKGFEGAFPPKRKIREQDKIRIQPEMIILKTFRR